MNWKFILQIFGVLVVFGLIAAVIQGQSIQHVLPVILMAVIGGALFLLYKATGKYPKCPKCKKMLAGKHQENRTTNETDISVPVEIQNKDSKGNVIGTSEQFVPGKRIAYEEVYKCKHCGEVFSFSKSKDVSHT